MTDFTSPYYDNQTSNHHSMTITSNHHIMTIRLQITILWQSHFKSPYYDNQTSHHHIMTIRLQITILWQTDFKSPYYDNHTSHHHIMTITLQITILWQTDFKSPYYDDQTSNHHIMTITLQITILWQTLTLCFSGTFYCKTKNRRSVRPAHCQASWNAINRLALVLWTLYQTNAHIHIACVNIKKDQKKHVLCSCKQWCLKPQWQIKVVISKWRFTTKS